jgi:hypothetical protein
LLSYNGKEFNQSIKDCYFRFRRFVAADRVFAEVGLVWISSRSQEIPISTEGWKVSSRCHPEKNNLKVKLI